MSTLTEFQALQSQLALAQAACMRWRSLSCGERYQQAFCEVEALELQLAICQRQLPAAQVPA
jgi:hypothetical protein